MNFKCVIAVVAFAVIACGFSTGVSAANGCDSISVLEEFSATTTYFPATVVTAQAYSAPIVATVVSNVANRRSNRIDSRRARRSNRRSNRNRRCG